MILNGIGFYREFKPFVDMRRPLSTARMLLFGMEE
jgi:hypothetical protein